MANGKMPNIKVVNLGGKEVGTFELDEIFAGEVNEALLWESVTRRVPSGAKTGTRVTRRRCGSPGFSVAKIFSI